MVRVVKEPDARRSEIIEAAAKLFFSKGIANTSVSDIVKAVGVAQGTFYWHFKSKQEVINAIVVQINEQYLQKALEIAESPDLDALEKLTGVRDELFREVTGDNELIEQYHHESNRQVHDQLVEMMTEQIVPLLGRIVEQGVEEGLFDTPYPHEAGAFIFGATQVMNEGRRFDAEVSRQRWKDALSDFVIKGLGYKGDLGQK